MNEKINQVKPTPTQEGISGSGSSFCSVSLREFDTSELWEKFIGKTITKVNAKPGTVDLIFDDGTVGNIHMSIPGELWDVLMNEKLGNNFYICGLIRSDQSVLFDSVVQS